MVGLARVFFRGELAPRWWVVDVLLSYLMIFLMSPVLFLVMRYFMIVIKFDLSPISAAKQLSPSMEGYSNSVYVISALGVLISMCILYFMQKREEDCDCDFCSGRLQGKWYHILFPFLSERMDKKYQYPYQVLDNEDLDSCRCHHCVWYHLEVLGNVSLNEATETATDLRADVMGVADLKHPSPIYVRVKFTKIQGCIIVFQREGVVSMELVSQLNNIHSYSHAADPKIVWDRMNHLGRTIQSVNVDRYMGCIKNVNVSADSVAFAYALFRRFKQTAGEWDFPSAPPE